MSEASELDDSPPTMYRRPAQTCCLLLGCFLLTAVLGWGRDALAQDGGFSATAEVERPMAATNEEDPTAAATVLRLEDRDEPVDELPDVLGELPGSQVIRTGGLGSFGALSLRGAELAHTTVLFGSLPLSGHDVGAFDFSLIPPSILNRVEVFRGGAPVWWSAGSIGGVVRLVPRSEPPEAASVEVRAGSFDRWGVEAEASTWSPALSTVTVVGMDATDGDYPYIDDGGTRLEPDDDVERRLRNGELLQAHAFSSVRVPLAEGTLELAALGFTRKAGEPGPGSSPSLGSERFATRATASLSYLREDDGPRRRWRWQLALGGGYERNRFRSFRMGEWDLADDETAVGYARVAGGTAVTEWLELTGLGTLRQESYRPDDTFDPDANSDRRTLAAAAEARLHHGLGGVRFELRPSVRVEWSEGTLQDTTIHGNFERRASRVSPTFRVGAAMAPLSWLTLAGSVASGIRPPTFVELFGNRVNLEANPALTPEHGTSVDAGAMAAGRWGILRGEAEVRWFRLAMDDLIRYRPTSQFRAVAENAGEGTVTGVEAGVRGRLTRHLRLTGSLTVLDTDNGHGKRLPLRPSLQAHLGPTDHTGSLWVLDDLVLFGSVSHLGERFRDPANFVRWAPRTHVGAGARVELLDRQLAMTFALDDLFDVRGDDVLGYPLPGRRWSARVLFRKDLEP